MRTAILSLVALASSAGATTPWEAYLALPTPENADRVQTLSYSDASGMDFSSDLQILRNQVLAQDAAAFSLGYRLYRTADGGNAEDLGALLASSIRPHPKFFLEQVDSLDSSCGAFRWILNVPGLEYVDRMRAQGYEIAKRREALSGVATRKLLTVRENCLSLLRQP